LFSLYNCWQELINETKKESQEHGVLAEVYNSHITTRLSMVMDDLQRIYKQVIRGGGRTYKLTKRRVRGNASL